MQDNNNQNSVNFDFEKSTEDVSTETNDPQDFQGEATQIRKTFPSSAIAMQQPEKRWKQAKYPWDTMEVNTSFQINYNEMKLNSLKPYVSRMSKKLNKIFKIIDHKQYQCYEICRHPDKPRNIVEASRQEQEKERNGG